MNTHKNARLTYLRRLKMVQDITERALSASQAATRHGVSAVTARKWLGRYLVGGAAALLDKSSRPERSPRAGLSRLSDLQPVEPVQRYERETPGELLHIDIKKLGRFEQVGHRITGKRQHRSRHSGGEYLTCSWPFS